MPDTFKQISRTACLVYRSLRNRKNWVTVREIVADNELPARSVRAIVQRMVDADIVDRQTVFAGFRYRLRDPDTQAALDLLERFHDAESVLGLTGEPT